MEDLNIFSKAYLDHTRKMREKFFQTGSTAGITGVRTDILACWEAYNIFRMNRGEDLSQPLQKGRTTAEEFSRALEESRDLLAVAEPYMHQLHSFLDPEHFWVMLMNEKGVVIKMVGSETSLAEARRTGVDEGAYRGGQSSYPGLLYACYQFDKPFQIVSTEHPNSIDDDIAGSGAPIHEVGSGRFLGAISISGHWWKSHNHTLGLTIMTAEAISQQLALIQRNREIVSANQKLNTALEAADFGMIYFHADGSIYSANQHAIDMISLKSGPKETFLKNGNIFGYFGSSLDQEKLRQIDQEIDSSGSYSFDIIPVQKYLPLHCTIRRVSRENQDYFIQLQKSSDLNKMAADRAISRTPFTFSDIIGTSQIFADAIDAARIAAKHSAAVLITGESGTGKEMFAQAIHNSSLRTQEPFVAINCGAIPKALIESELFGYEAGAFTGAHKNGQPGKFELANKGTIFLDEIGDMPYEIQVALLRVLQTQEVVRIGGRTPIKIDVRVIAATNQNLEMRIRENTFRQDLYYRLNVLNIRLPALRERTEDIAVLSNYFIAKYGCAFNKKIEGFSKEALAAMGAYSWPGNVRELENTVERAVIVSDGTILEVEDLPEGVRACRTDSGTAGRAAPAGSRPASGAAGQTYAQLEAEALRECLRACGGNLSDVAKRLGVSRPTVYRKLKKYGLYVKNRYEGQ